MSAASAGPDGSGTAAANGIEIAYETFGNPSDRPLLLVMGLGGPMIAWHPDMCAQLAGRGFFVIRFDNRDVGRSTHLAAAGMPNLMAAMMGDARSAPYSLDDMADDAVGLLDALDIPAAHIAGMSLGGMIVQTIAVRHPDRVRSLTSIMSTPSPALSKPDPQAQAALMMPPPATRDAAIEQMRSMTRIVSGPGFPPDEAWETELAGAIYDQGMDPVGVARQTMAIFASGDRTEAVRGITAPTLVFHGEADPLIHVDAGRFTAQIIEGAELVVVPGMGHSLPRDVWPQLVDAIDRVAGRSAST